MLYWVAAGPQKRALTTNTCRALPGRPPSGRCALVTIKVDPDPTRLWLMGCISIWIKDRKGQMGRRAQTLHITGGVKQLWINQVTIVYILYSTDFWERFQRRVCSSLLLIWGILPDHESQSQRMLIIALRKEAISTGSIHISPQTETFSLGFGLNIHYFTLQRP